MSVSGKIVRWDDGKGFGFIAPDAGGRQIFVHIKAFPKGAARPTFGSKVRYEIITDEEGQSRAENVRLAGRKLPSAAALFSLSAACAFLAAVYWLTFTGRLPLAALWFYLGASVITFGIYAADKSAAKRHAWRTSENTLHLFAMLGGWPGALCAQQLLRHKSRKASFQVVFGVTVAVNVAVLLFVLTPYGAPYIETFLSLVD